MYALEPLQSSDNILKSEGLSQSQLGFIPDWQFYPSPPPIGTGTFEKVTIQDPQCNSWGVSEQYLNGAALGDWGDLSLKVSGGVWAALALIPLMGGAAAAYHGYKRNNDDVGSALLWGFVGLLFPTHTVAYALGQGFAKEER